MIKDILRHDNEISTEISIRIGKALREIFNEEDQIDWSGRGFDKVPARRLRGIIEDIFEKEIHDAVKERVGEIVNRERFIDDVVKRISNKQL